MANPASQANSNLYFVPIKGRWERVLKPFKASTAIPLGYAVGIEISGNTTTGNLTLMGVENAAGADFVGIMDEAIAATDTDYATAGKMKYVLIPSDRQALAEFKVGAGTFTNADVGKTVEFHSDSASLAVDTAGKGARIEGYISSTRGICSFVLPATETA
jgi:hypothetical protein